ncbi:hypothetical protein SEA_SHAM_258 [Streptomyces phage Sham]|nr:hypothetical protein SEA_SHAM_258 [Streptomyces phage Sham]
MRWIPLGWNAFREIQSESRETVTDSYDGITLYFGETISAIRRMGNRMYIYETNFREAFEIDITELLPGDVVWHCLEDGPVSSHEPYSAYPETEELVFWQSGMSDRFGKPQKIEVLRGGQF